MTWLIDRIFYWLALRRLPSREDIAAAAGDAPQEWVEERSFSVERKEGG